LSWHDQNARGHRPVRILFRRHQGLVSLAEGEPLLGGSHIAAHPLVAQLENRSFKGGNLPPVALADDFEKRALARVASQGFEGGRRALAALISGLARLELACHRRAIEAPAVDALGLGHHATSLARSDASIGNERK